jgi:hypothetical protein
MLESLTPEQEKLMYRVRDFWIDRVNKFHFSDTKCVHLIRFVYRISGLERPEIVFCDSLVEMQQKANELNKTTGTVYQYSSRVCFGDLEWISFYDFFRRIGIAKDRKFTIYAHLMQYPPYKIITDVKGYCLVCRPPVKISRNKYRQLSNETGPCIICPDGNHRYFINGVEFTKEEWSDFFPIKQGDEIATKILGISNTEKRTAVIMSYGLEVIINKLGAKILDTSTEYSEHLKRNVTCNLIEFQYMNNALKGFQFEDLSTGKKGIELVDRSCKTLKEALAWRFNKTPEEMEKYEIIWHS